MQLKQIREHMAKIAAPRDTTWGTKITMQMGKQIIELRSRATASVPTWAPRVEKQHKLPQESGEDLVPWGYLEDEIVSSDDGIGWARYCKSSVARLTGSLDSTPATCTHLREVKHSLCTVRFWGGWPCQKEGMIDLHYRVWFQY